MSCGTINISPHFTVWWFADIKISFLNVSLFKVWEILLKNIGTAGVFLVPVIFSQGLSGLCCRQGRAAPRHEMRDSISGETTEILDLLLGSSHPLAHRPLSPIAEVFVTHFPQFSNYSLNTHTRR